METIESLEEVSSARAVSTKVSEVTNHLTPDVVTTRLRTRTGGDSQDLILSISPASPKHLAAEAAVTKHVTADRE